MAKTITIPFQYEPRWYQLPILQSQARYKVVVAHRRSGKSKTVLNQQIAKAMTKKGMYLYLLPTLQQAKKVVWLDRDMMQHFPPEIVEKANESEHYIKLKNGSIWMLGGVNEPDAWRGTNPIDIVFDEFAEMDPSVWTHIFRPVLSQNGGSATFVFTPKGVNHAHDLLTYAKQNDGGQWGHWVLPVSVTKAIDDEELAEAKRSTPQAVYEQEYEVKFIEGATQAFKRIRENLWIGEIKILPGKSFDLGVDLAKFQDWTVITPFDRHLMAAGVQDRFNQIDYTLQKAKIEAAARRFNNGRVRIDSTGVGEPIFEDLRRAGLNIEPYLFTEKSRDDLLTNLAIKLEQDKIKIPDDEGLIGELAAARYEVFGRGKVRITWPEGVTKDRVMSLALALWSNESRLPHDSVRRASSEFGDSENVQSASRFHY